MRGKCSIYTYIGGIKKSIFVGIKSLLDAQVWLVNKAVELGCQLSVKYQEWQYHRGNVSMFDYLEFRGHIGNYADVAHNMGVIGLAVISIIVGLVFLPSFAGKYAVFIGRLKARFGIWNKVWVFDPAANRDYPVTIPKEQLAFSSVSAAENAGAFDDISGLSASEINQLPIGVGALVKAGTTGLFLSKCIGAYLIFFPFYYLFFGRVDWLYYIRAW